MQQGKQYANSDSNKMSCETTTFQLKKAGVSSTCISVEVNFSPIVYSSSPSQSLLQKQSIQAQSKAFPVYNVDKKYFTPSFILQVDQKKYRQNQHIYQALFQKKVLQMNEQRQEMFLPKPSKNNSFCCVCKTAFQDYLTHVNLPMHKVFMYKSQFHEYIKQLCTPYNVMHQQDLGQKKHAIKNKSKGIKKLQKAKKQKRFGFGNCSTTIQTQNFMNGIERAQKICQCQ